MLPNLFINPLSILVAFLIIGFVIVFLQSINRHKESKKEKAMEQARQQAIWLINHEKEEAIRQAALRDKAQSIINSGGPHTLDEMLFLFPVACDKCGSRNIITATHEYVVAGAPDYSSDPMYPCGSLPDPHTDYVRWCERCGKPPEAPDGSWSSKLVDVKKERVGSPYLSVDVSSLIPDWSNAKVKQRESARV